MTGFYVGNPVVPCSYHSVSATYIFNHLPLKLNELGD